MNNLQNAQNALLREIILDALDGLADENGVIQADPLAATEEIMERITLSDGGTEE